MNASSTASVLALFLAQTERAPDAPCLLWRGATLTYRDVLAAALEVAAGLRALGVKPGDRVALALENGPRWVSAYLGVGFAGGVVVPINTQYRARELMHLLGDSEVSLAVAGSAALAEVMALRSDLPSLRHVVAAEGEATGSLTWPTLLGRHVEPRLPAADDLALLVYTSGTTGRAKGVMLAHGNLAANAQAITQAWGWTSADRLLLMLPLFHIHGLGVGLHGTLSTGASVDLRPRFDAVEALTALASGDDSLFFGVPTMYGRLLAAAQERAERPKGVRLFVSGSAPLSPSLFAEFERVFGQTILERYGMSEGGMLTTNPLGGPRRAGTVGVPFPGQVVRVGKPSRPAPVGEVGPVWVRGPNLFRGYWRQPEATAAVFQGEWFNTGDLGFLDADGVLTLVGRAKELIITGGFNVYPREVEDVLVTHPQVAEAAVVGLPDDDLGEQVAAFVVPRDPALTPDELVDYCRARLAPYKKPRRVVFVPALPRNAMGKVQKDALKG